MDVPSEGPPTNGKTSSARDRVGECLGAWQPVELRVARGFRECRGLNREQLEDIYQDTTIALLARSHDSEEHLRNALRTGIKQRALNAHRDERRRLAILQSHAPALHAVAAGKAHELAPELVALAQEDRLIVNEFLAELTGLERRVFGLVAQGMRYRRIATILDLDVKIARSMVSACERKRERYQTLYDTGRLCGYRANTIRALKAGDATSVQLAERAAAHLDACPRCRLEHGVSARRLREHFQGQAAALLPPVLLGAHAPRLASLAIRVRGLAHTQLERVSLPLPAVSTKAAAGLAAIVLVAGGTASTVRAVDHSASRVRHHPNHAAADHGGSGPLASTRTRDAALESSTPVAHVARDTGTSAPGRSGPARATLEFGPSNTPQASVGGVGDDGVTAAEREFGPEH